MKYILYFEDFKPGDSFESPGITITEAAIIDFAMRYDPQPFHLDKEAAKKSIFGSLISSGILTLALTGNMFRMTGVLDNNLGSQGIDEIRWLKPVYPGDTLKVVADVMEVEPSASKSDRGTVRVRYTTVNQRHEPVQTFFCNQIIRRRPAGQES